MEEKKGVCYVAQSVGYVENGELFFTRYYGKETIANVGIDLMASDLYHKEAVYDLWFCESTKEKLDDAIDNWEYEMHMALKRQQEEK